MATPSDIHLKNLNGKWVIDKTLSADPKPSMKIQAINWILRKAIALSSVTQHISMNTEVATSKIEVSSSQQPGTYVNIVQIPTGGFAEISENRVLHWDQPTILKDFLFGLRKTRSRYISGAKGEDGIIRPSIKPETRIQDEIVGMVLRGERFPGSDNDDGTGGFIVETDGNGLWIQTFDEHEELGWTVEQVWGFEMIGGERYYTRRFVVANKEGLYELGRIVFSYQGPKP